MRIGHGFDVHQFGGESPLIIGGVCIPYPQGLLAHSDGDVALHAATDALLGAAALGDIGKLFPDIDPVYKGVDSRALLREAWLRIVAKGYCLGNLDITLIVQAPKMAPHIPQMRVHIAEDLGCRMDDINVKATTTERLGFTGRGEGIACEAVALLMRTDMTNDLDYHRLHWLLSKFCDRLREGQCRESSGARAAWFRARWMVKGVPVQKRLHNMPDVTKALAAFTGISARAISYAGLKDRYSAADE